MNNFLTKLKEKRVSLIVGIVTLLICVISATYAYYSLQISENSTSTIFNVEMGKLNSIAIKGLVDNLHLNVSVGDMSLENQGSYYATKETNENYEKDISTATYDIAELQIEGKVESKNNCTGELTVSLTHTEESMGSVLETGDAFLYIKGGNIEEKLDLSTIKTEGFKTYTIKFKVNDNSKQTVKAYIELVNKEEAQNYLAGKTLNLEIKINNFKCEVYNTETLANLCSDYDNLSDCITYADLDGVANLEATANMEERSDNLRRYQGDAFDVDNNYVCFGTTKKSDCTTDTDKYMYRIIGLVTKEGDNETEKIGQIKVIKKEALSETKSWHNTTGDDVTWDNSELNIGINGSYFLTNTEAYPYMGNRNWTSQIVNHNWRYGDLLSPADYASGIAVLSKEKSWSTSIQAHIGLMYLSDYYLAYNSTRNWVSDYDKSNWLLLQNNDKNPPYNYEWAMSRYNGSYAWLVNNNGFVSSYGFLERKFSVRPVFYVENTMQIVSGSGTIEDPYMFGEPPEAPESASIVIPTLEANSDETQLQSAPIEGDTLRRFQSTDLTKVKNNYICFGAASCSDKDDHMYRIIGVVAKAGETTGEKVGMLKIIKQKPLSNSHVWNSSTGVEWNTASLNTDLNSTYFLTNTTYVPNESETGGLDWKTLIANIKWRYGDIDNTSSGASQAGPKVLEKEKTWQSTVEAKIGLMYLSDYYLAYDNTSNWYSKSGSDNWLFIDNNDTSPIQHYEWTMSRYGSDYAWFVRSGGSVNYAAALTSARSVRPVFYLISSVQLRGTGTTTDPYTISAA